ncbi:nuclear transport factor 2 family protein [Conyzicola sp.]|uniref:nuclear transport factor 2 family protein n=1 Tax=Conyzicola sp. TaxID=1969404 RepID=UPI0039896133
MTTTDDVTRWVEAYRSAWISNDADEIGALFTEDALYEFRPNDPDPWRGRDEIVTGWIEEPDSPEVWKLDVRVLGVLADDTAVAQAFVEYLDDRPDYDDLWFIELENGRARRFTEWPVKRS